MSTTADISPHVDERPTGHPIMYQTWDKGLFMHWPVSPDLLRPLIPDKLRIDTFDGAAWIGIAPFMVRNVRPPFHIPVPWIGDFCEVDVRVCVSAKDIPGVWFLSLDASNGSVVKGGRAFFHLPYFKAKISMEQQEGTIACGSFRDEGDRSARFNAVWTVGNDMPIAEPGTLDHFLLERYCFYAFEEGSLYRTRIFHRPRPLRESYVLAYLSTLIESAGLPRPDGDPVLHCSGPVDVGVWPLEKV